MLFTILGFLGVQRINKTLNTQANKSSANKWGVYRDGNGDYRLRQNGKKVVDTYDSHGDYVIKYVHNGITAINITKEESKLREDEAKRTGKRFYLRQIDGNAKGKLGAQDIYGDRYCEVNKPNIYYVKRYVDYTSDDYRGYFGEFYMDMKCRLVCPTDEQIEKDNNILQKNNKIYGIINDNDLYDLILNEWNKYISNPYVNVKYINLHKIGLTQKKDYKIYTDKITKWKI